MVFKTLNEMPPDIAEIIMDAFNNLKIPISPSNARIEQLPEIAFMALLIEAVQLAHQSNIVYERRKDIMAEIILVDERITKNAKSKAESYVDKAIKSQLN